MKRIYYFFFALVLLCTACEKEQFDVTSITRTEIAPHTSTADVTIYVADQNGNTSNATIEEVGVFLSTQSEPTANDERLSVSNSEKWKSEYSFSIEGLASNTTYYALPFVSNQFGMVTGEVVTFSTGKAPFDNTITLKMGEIEDISYNTATFSGSITIGPDAMGTIKECGFICSTEPQPSFDDMYRSWKFNSTYNPDFSSWSGTKQLSGTVNKLRDATTYYVRMYYQIGSDIYYDSTIKSFSTKSYSSSSWLTVSEALAIFNSMDLTSNSTSNSKFTIRGYVTNWYSGYPQYKNGEFEIYDTPSFYGNPPYATLRVYRIPGLNESDRRTLEQGEYVEIKDCNVRLYNSKYALVNGSFTVLQ